MRAVEDGYLALPGVSEEASARSGGMSRVRERRAQSRGNGMNKSGGVQMSWDTVCLEGGRREGWTQRD